MPIYYNPLSDIGKEGIMQEVLLNNEQINPEPFKPNQLVVSLPNHKEGII
jgi:hypothetical protein